MAGRSAGPIARAKLAFREQIITTDIDTLNELYEDKCYPGHPNARNCPLCYIWKQAGKGLWYPIYKFPDGIWYPVPKAELWQRIAKQVFKKVA